MIDPSKITQRCVICQAQIMQNRLSTYNEYKNISNERNQISTNENANDGLGKWNEDGDNQNGHRPNRIELG